ncbi:hypothetical protein NMY22_g15088 [Coprinellus aureogranulatus]|nr:hypothetical protein NMY22_g15088 [Coprinellus aureogranulatus]
MPNSPESKVNKPSRVQLQSSPSSARIGRCDRRRVRVTERVSVTLHQRAPLSTLPPPPPHTPPHCTGQDRVQLYAMVSRGVWLAALDRVCEQHGIYKPGYPTEKMTLAELKHAASGPHRFVKWVKEFELTSLLVCKQPYLSRQISSRRRANDPDDMDGAISHVLLIPGGRFLVTVMTPRTAAGEGTMCLWDLGYNMHCPAKLFPIATTPVQGAFHNLGACLNENGKEIILAVYGYPAFICRNSVIAMDDAQDFLIWEIPKKLPPAVAGEELPEILNHPKRARRRHERESLPYISMTASSSFQHLAPPHLCLVIDEDDDPGNHDRKVYLYSLQRIECRTDAFVPKHLPIAGGEAESLAGALERRIVYPSSPLFYCDGSLLMCSCSTENELIAAVLPTPTEASEDLVNLHSAFLVHALDVNEVCLNLNSVGFCPMSGRVVYPISSNSLQISDFLLPLEERSALTYLELSPGANLTFIIQGRRLKQCHSELPQYAIPPFADPRRSTRAAT